MMRRRRGRGLVGAMATTAVVAGTAGAVHHRQEQRYQNKAMEQQAQQAAYESQADIADMQAQMQAMQAQQAAAAMPGAAAAAAAPAAADPLTEKLTQLANLHAQGILTDEEFASAKAQALSTM